MGASCGWGWVSIRAQAIRTCSVAHTLREGFSEQYLTKVGRGVTTKFVHCHNWGKARDDLGSGRSVSVRAAVLETPRATQDSACVHTWLMFQLFGRAHRAPAPTSVGRGPGRERHNTTCSPELPCAVQHHSRTEMVSESAQRARACARWFGILDGVAAAVTSAPRPCA